jgi:hypothetical protein
VVGLETPRVDTRTFGGEGQPAANRDHPSGAVPTVGEVAEPADTSEFHDGETGGDTQGRPAESAPQRQQP